jgi:hypothetical protein
MIQIYRQYGVWAMGKKKKGDLDRADHGVRIASERRSTGN